MDQETAAGEQRQHLLGIALLLGAVACFAGLDASAKWVNRSVNPVETAAVRYLGSFLLVSALLNPWTRPGLLRTRSLRLQCARAFFLVLATVCNFVALRYLPLTQNTSITFSSPLFIALLAGPLLGEPFDGRRLAAILTGFGGVLVVTRPGAGSIHPAALFSVVTACATALYSISTRRLASRDPATTTLFYTGFVGSLLMLPAVPFVWVTPSSPLVWLLMAALGGLGALGHWFLILAHRRAPASVLAPFFYAQLLFAALLGGLVFGELPDRWTLLGGAIVIASGLYLLHRTRRLGGAGR